MHQQSPPLPPQPQQQFSTARTATATATATAKGEQRAPQSRPLQVASPQFPVTELERDNSRSSSDFRSSYNERFVNDRTPDRRHRLDPNSDRYDSLSSDPSLSSDVSVARPATKPISVGASSSDTRNFELPPPMPQQNRFGGAFGQLREGPGSFDFGGGQCDARPTSSRPERNYAQFAERDVPFEDGRRLPAARSAHNVSVASVGEPRLTNFSLVGHGSRRDRDNMDVELAGGGGTRQRPARALSGGRFYMSSSEEDELTDRSESERVRGGNGSGSGRHGHGYGSGYGYMSADEHEHEHLVTRVPPDTCSGT